MMINLALLSFYLFAAGMFVVLNGPLWLSVHARVFATGRQAPTWLQQGVSWLSRLVGLAILVTWAWVSTGALKPTLLLCVAVSIGLFLVFNGPIWLVVRLRIFHRGQEAPAWANAIAVWFLRLGGVVALLAAVATGIRIVTG